MNAPPQTLHKDVVQVPHLTIHADLDTLLQEQAGGQSLTPLLKLRFAGPTALIDIGGITDLKSITVDDGVVCIGALATHWGISSSKEVDHACSMLWDAARGIGDAQVRNRARMSLQRTKPGGLLRELMRF